PNLFALAAQLGLRLHPAERSFSVQQLGAGPHGDPLEWASGELTGLFAQARQWFRPRHWRLLAEVWRFQRQCAAWAREQAEAPTAPHAAWRQALGEWLRAQGLSRGFRDGYLLPVLGGLWGGQPEDWLRLPVAAAMHWCRRQGQRLDHGG